MTTGSGFVPRPSPAKGEDGSVRPRDAVLITRPQPGAAETAGRIAALGLYPIVAPVLEIRARPARLPRPARVQAVLVTSGNAVTTLSAAFHALPLLTVGDATACKAQAAGFVSVASAGGDADALATLAGQKCDRHGLPLLLAVAKGESLPLLSALRGQGFRVIRRTVYAAVPAAELPAAGRDALTSNRLRAILFFSAATACQFTRLLSRAGLRDRAAGIDACTISPRTAAAIEGLPWRRVLCAAHPTQDAMLALLS
jgi:uroporphyrinogen-III synthase